MLAPNVAVTIEPRKGLGIVLRYTAYWAHHLKDAMYNDAGTALRRNPAGADGPQYGHDLDFFLTCSLDVHQTIFAGWSHFWNGEFVRSTGFSDDEDFLYVGYSLKF